MGADGTPVRGTAGAPSAGPSGRYRALPAQHGMILNTLRFPEDGVDVIQITLGWPEPLELDPFEAAWRDAVRRYPILRTAFLLDDEKGLVQIADPAASIDIRRLDLPPAPSSATSSGSLSGLDDPFEAFLRADRREGFEVGRPPLVRLTILSRGGAPAHQVVLTLHHALIDGRSVRSLIAEVCASYAAGRVGRAVSHPPRPPFHEFVQWWQSADMSMSEKFWTGYLADTVPARPLPGYLAVLGVKPSGFAEPMKAETVLSRDDSDRIRETARACGLSSSTMISAVWALLRARYGGVTDVVLAVTRSCRYDSIPDADSVIGVLINTVPLRVRFDPQWSVRALLTAVNDGIHRIREHQLAPMASILAWAGLPADTALVDSLVAFERCTLQTGLAGGESAPDTARLDRLPSYPMTVYAFDEPEIQLSVLWDGRRFAHGSAERMLAQLRAVLVGFADEPLTALADLVVGDEADILAEWNRTDAAYPRDATMGSVFAAQVARDPDAIAVVAGFRTWTYAELDRRSNAMAWALRRRGVGTDTPVAVALPRGVDLIVALLAVLKAGGAYLPIDAGTPVSRAAAMLAGVRFALVSDQTAAIVPETDDIELIRIGDLVATSSDTLDGAEGIRADGLSALPTDQDVPPPDVAHPLSLAYLSFTSGSTGVPKGVAVPHRAVVRLVSGPTFATLGPGERLLHLAPVAFDASTLEIWGALLTGAAIVVAPPGPLGLPEIASLLRTSGATVVWLTAGLFHQLTETDIDALADVPQILAGGDVLNPDAVRAVLAARAGRPLVNGYGPTENITFTACHVMTDPSQVGPTVPIGRPIQHTTVHILDQDGRPTPIGVVGELYTGGDGVARGYAGNPSATALSFVPDPYGHGARLYRTGDLARWRADGILEFIGRADDQTKIRGFRVEPGEVEAVLRTHPGVREAIVVVHGDGAQRHLVGYVISGDGADPGVVRPSQLREFVAQRLPEYLVPTSFAVLDRFPLNANGKVDRAALPAPESEVRDESTTPPRGATEQQLADIWRRLLSVDGTRGERRDIGREDSFFALGGNSLSAARLMFRVRKEFGVDLRLGSFYEAPTLVACAAAIDAAAVPGTTAGRTIGRRSRSAYRVQPSAPPSSEFLAPHLIRLTDDWALWRTVCLRAAGLPLHLLDALGDTVLADATDDDAFEAEFPAAVRRLGAALYEAASLPALREAVAWQNRHALTTGIDALIRRGPEAAARNTKHRQHEALVASYLQRYCAKNETIGFFGPVSWSEIDDGPGVRITYASATASVTASAPATELASVSATATAPETASALASADSVSARITYLEGWAVRAVLADHVKALRPWLVLRRMPFVGLDGALLYLPLAPPVQLTPTESAVLRACDGIRDANEVAVEVLADPSAGVHEVAEVFDVLERLANSRRLAWQLDVAPQDIRPERSVRTLLARVTDDSVRVPAEAVLNELTAARDALADAVGDPEHVASAMAALETTFTRLAGVAPTRRAGALYAGRTLAYEECLRADTVRLGADALDGIRDALALVLDSARWFTASCGALYTHHFEEIHRQRSADLGTEAVPFADFWLLANDALFDQSSPLVEPAVNELQQRWSEIFGSQTGSDGRRIQLRASDLRELVASAFPAPLRPAWPMAVHHSPDLMIAGADAAGGRLTWVLGEIHPSIVTSRYATWLEFHDDPDTLRRAMRNDLGGSIVFVAETAEENGVCSRLSNALASPDDVRLIFAHDSCGYDPRTTLTVGECEVVASPTGLRVRRRDGSLERGLLEVVGDLLTAVLAQRFHLVPRGAHTPRITIDDLVVSRESWTFPATEPAFADLADERVRYRRVRAWVAEHDLPRHVFLRFTGERKPIYADLTSLASIDLISRALRRSRRGASADVAADANVATVTVVEMLPTPDQAWLTDAEGRRYSAELRMVAVDRKRRS